MGGVQSLQTIGEIQRVHPVGQSEPKRERFPIRTIGVNDRRGARPRSRFSRSLLIPFGLERGDAEGRTLVFSSRSRHVTVVCRRLRVHTVGLGLSRKLLELIRDRAKKSLHFQTRIAFAVSRSQLSILCWDMALCRVASKRCLANFRRFRDRVHSSTVQFVCNFGVASSVVNLGSSQSFRILEFHNDSIEPHK